MRGASGSLYPVGQPYDPWWRDRPAGLGGLAP
eukprot:COSAG01_NODE_73548_length_242_cov_22.489510_1_plen_31_part_01